MSSAAMPTITIAILSSQCLVWLGLQKIFESIATIQMVVPPHQDNTLNGLFSDNRPDVFILDVETERDAISTITQIRKSAPTSKIVLLCGLEDKDRMREAFAAGVDGIILTVQPPEVVLAVIEALYAPPEASGRQGTGWHGKNRPRNTLHEKGGTQSSTAGVA